MSSSWTETIDQSKKKLQTLARWGQKNELALKTLVKEIRGKLRVMNKKSMLDQQENI